MAIAEALDAVRAGVDAAAREAGRTPGSVRLIAISKTHDASAVGEAIAAGQMLFGENRVQEAEAKFPPLKAATPALELHLVGALQGNKARQAVALFDVIHSLDRPSLATRLAQASAELGRRPMVLIQVNTGAEPQKAGVLPDEAGRLVDQARALGLDLRGLMCIPPVDQDPRPHFEALAGLAGRFGLTWLSMGMSGDYPVAIACGATHVRVGTAIFGSRRPAPV